MIAAQVLLGKRLVHINIGGATGHFELNVFKPMISIISCTAPADPGTVV